MRAYCTRQEPVWAVFINWLFHRRKCVFFVQIEQADILTLFNSRTEVNTPQAAQAWSVIYKTFYESLTRFRKLLENGPK